MAQRPLTSQKKVTPLGSNLRKIFGVRKENLSS